MIIDLVSVYGTDKMNFSKNLKRALEVKPPCDLIFEYNESGEVVVRVNKIDGPRG